MQTSVVVWPMRSSEYLQECWRAIISNRVEKRVAVGPIGRAGAGISAASGLIPYHGWDFQSRSFRNAAATDLPQVVIPHPPHV
ncbi:hypothetical protein [Fuerstiella marisgermanici]|uniref:Uncharacterized protein n=1 Tax=Fuerstiella marisgermanici TaxID=1891926 RepID=A0A1P8WKP2_9PLAN|nr:hypothetical protein [Fuerstiella marisgermanici]APZ94628.1 hypothetical protein Fuma_04261 [Fuerstiella marisgermanici]